MSEPPVPPPPRGLNPAWILAGCAGIGLILIAVMGAFSGLLYLNRRAAAESATSAAARSFPPPTAYPAATAAPAPEPAPVSEAERELEKLRRAQGESNPAPDSDSRKAFGPYRLVFHVKTGRWTNQIIITPWGDVVAIGGHVFKLLARDTGAQLLSAAACFTQAPDAAAFVDERRLILACSREVQEIAFPVGYARQIFTFPADMERTAIGGGRVVAGVNTFGSSRSNDVFVYALDGFREVDSFDVGSAVQGVAISADGQRVAVGVDGPDLALRDVAAHETRMLTRTPRSRHSALRFSPDGKGLFAEIASFQGGEIDLATGAARSVYATSSWLTTIRYAGAPGVLATGAGDLVLFGRPGQVTSAPVRDLGNGLDISADGTYLCAAGSSGDVACFSTKPVEPSTFAAGVDRGGGGAGR